MPLTEQQEREIFPILDAALDLEPGKAILRKCTVRRADYLTRMILGLRYDTALESILMYQPGEPLYGLGLYGLIWAEPHEQGLLCTKLEAPHRTLVWMLIECAAQKQDVIFPPHAKYAIMRQRLARMQKKYPEVTDPIWLEDSNPLIAHYSEATAEEFVIVDIDRVDDHPIVPPPSPEQKAKARQGRHKR